MELETNTGDLVFWTSESTDNVQGASSHQFGTSVDDVLNNDTTLQGVTTYTFTTPNAECPSLPMVVDDCGSFQCLFLQRLMSPFVLVKQCRVQLSHKFRMAHGVGPTPTTTSALTTPELATFPMEHQQRKH